MTWLRGDDRAVANAHGSKLEHDAGLSAQPDAQQPPPMTLWRKLAVAAILVALIVGIGWQLKPSNDRDGRVVTPAPSTTTVADPSTSAPATVDPSKPPELRNTGEDFDTIVRSANDFENWAYQYDPDPKWAPFIVDPLNEDEFGFKRLQDSLTALQSAGHRYDSSTVKIHKVTLRDRVNENHAGLYVVREHLPGSVVDGGGTVVRQLATLSPTGYFEDWVRGDDGRWRLLQSVVLGPPGKGVLP